MQGPFFDYAPFSIFYAVYYYKCLGFYFFKFRIKFVDFKAGYDREYDINFFGRSVFSITSLATIYCHSPTHFVDNHISYCLAMPRNNRNAYIFLYTLHKKVEGFGGSQIGNHRIHGYINSQKISSRRKN